MRKPLSAVKRAKLWRVLLAEGDIPSQTGYPAAGGSPTSEEVAVFEFGAISLSVLALGGLLSAGLLTVDDITIGEFHVPPALEWDGWSGEVVQHRLHDHLDRVIETAGSELTALDLHPTTLERSVSSLQNYFELDTLADGARLALGLMPYYLSGEVTRQEGEVLLTVRVYDDASDHPGIHIVQERGTAAEMDQILRAAALGVLEEINPYLVGLYLRRIEEAEGHLRFPRALLAADRILATRPLEEHYLAYGLRGRTFMRQAELATEAGFEAQEASYREAINAFRAALRREPGFAYAHTNLAIIYAVLGDFGAANRHFAEAVTLQPNDLQTRIRWAESLEREGDIVGAAYQYVAAVTLSPDNAQLRDRLGDLYIQLGQVDAALVQYEAAIDLDPGNDTYRDVRQTLIGTTE